MRRADLHDLLNHSTCIRYAVCVVVRLRIGSPTFIRRKREVVGEVRSLVEAMEGRVVLSQVFAMIGVVAAPNVQCDETR